MSHYPVLLDLRGRQALGVGGGLVEHLRVNDHSSVDRMVQSPVGGTVTLKRQGVGCD